MSATLSARLRVSGQQMRECLSVVAKETKGTSACDGTVLYLNCGGGENSLSCLVKMQSILPCVNFIIKKLKTGYKNKEDFAQLHLHFGLTSQERIRKTGIC